MATYRKRGDKWQVQVRRLGHEPTAATFHRKADAEAWARQREAELDRGVHQVDRQSLRTTKLSDLLIRYEREVTPRKRSREVETYYLRALASHALGSTPLDKLTTGRLAAYRGERLAIVRSSSVRREFNVLRHCLEVAIQEWHVPLPTNPLKGLRLPSDPPARERRISQDELQRLAKALASTRNAFLVSVINLAIFTGMRRSELLGLTWRNVDLQRGLAFLPNTKNGRPRTVPLSPAAKNVIAGLERREPDTVVLPMSGNAVRLSWERLKRRQA